MPPRLPPPWLGQRKKYAIWYFGLSTSPANFRETLKVNMMQVLYFYVNDFCFA